MKNNPKPRPKIIFFDIDDTLYIKDMHSIPKSIQPALMALKQNGITLAIATGRSLGIIPTGKASFSNKKGSISLVIKLAGGGYW